MAFLISSGEGIPGVGVTPGLRPFLSVAGSGMPGVGVAPFGKLAIVGGIPGVELPEGWIGSELSPGGILAGSSFMALFALALEFAAFVGPELPQAVKNIAIASAVVRNRYFIKFKIPLSRT